MSDDSKVEESPSVEAPIHGDMLEAILTYVPLIYLVPACHVSKQWSRAVSTSLRHQNPIKPWLLLHIQRTRHPYSTASYAYDPRSRIWVQIHQPPIKYVYALRSSHLTLLYMLSPSKFLFSFDPLHLTWHHVDAPIVWRTDPIVALVGHRVIVAGGACDFEEDPLAVEMYDLKSRTWDRCESMPTIFKDSAASMWLSVTADSNKMYVVQKSSGIMYSFDPITNAWQGPYNVKPTTDVRSCIIGFAKDQFMMVGLTEEINGVNVKVWRVDGESWEFVKVIGEMPKELVEKLRVDSWSTSSVIVSLIDDFMYINNTSAPGEMIVCELGDGGDCKWSSVENVIVGDDCLLRDRLVFTCSYVGLKDLHIAMTAHNCKFAAKSNVC
ncbi:hypothetical protein K2173_008293 [Erythroxylum novogranatense]|uniref:F-box domain-containing protein n=1 Tax=Erythroxylum novogranatense TaxID=1862640 RepID=A0AAV8U3L0_9ROSI|nr:hypothetical protein K2173_008293 [Erythroxylum novogranatense]